MNTTLGQSKIAKRYVGSLFSEFSSKKDIDTAAKDIADLGAMLNGSKDLRDFIKSPIISVAQHIEGIKNLADKAKFSSSVKNFLMVLAHNRRLSILPVIVSEAQAHIARMSSIVPVSVVSARALGAAEQKKIQSDIQTALGKDISMQTSVDESLIGGLVVQIESVLIDGSIKTKLDKLERKLVSGKAA